jgi:hypothetical protein
MGRVLTRAFLSSKASFMRSFLRQILCIMFVTHGIARAQDLSLPQSDSTPPLVNFQLPLELGGYFTFDAATPLSHWVKLDIPYQLSWMELTAQAPISENVTGAITLLSTGDLEKLRIWQCMAAWQMGDWILSGGQQNFHFGLFTTRTVSGPLIWDSAWRNAAGSEVGWKQSEALTLGLGFASLLNAADSAAGRKETHDPTMTGYVDWTPREGNDFRLSGLANTHFQDLDAAATLTVNRLLFDAEIWKRFNSGSRPDYLGWYAGAGLQLTDKLVGGIRYDRISLDDGAHWTDKICAGGVMKFFRDLFVGGEIGHDEKMGYYLDLQFGLSTHLGLDGVTPRQPGR